MELTGPRELSGMPRTNDPEQRMEYQNIEAMRKNCPNLAFDYQDAQTNKAINITTNVFILPSCNQEYMSYLANLQLS